MHPAFFGISTVEQSHSASSSFILKLGDKDNWKFLFFWRLDMVFNNGVWAIKKQQATIPENPFEVFDRWAIDGDDQALNLCKARAQYWFNFHKCWSFTLPGYLRLKAGADPKPTHNRSVRVSPSVQSYGHATSRFKFIPQLQTVALTHPKSMDGTNSPANQGLQLEAFT